MHIHQDQPRLPFLPSSDGCLAVIRALYRKANSSQQFHQPVPLLKLIVDDQDSGNFRAGTYTFDAARSTPPDGYSAVATFDRDLQPEYRALPQAGGNCDIASHQARVFAGNGQPQAGSFGLVKTALGL